MREPRFSRSSAGTGLRACFAPVRVAQSVAEDDARSRGGSACRVHMRVWVGPWRSRARDCWHRGCHLVHHAAVVGGRRGERRCRSRGAGRSARARGAVDERRELAAAVERDAQKRSARRSSERDASRGGRGSFERDIAPGGISRRPTSDRDSRAFARARSQRGVARVRGRCAPALRAGRGVVPLDPERASHRLSRRLAPSVSAPRGGD